MESQAPPSAGWYNFLGWLETNRKRVIIGAAIVVLVGCVIGLLVWQHSEREGEAAEALAGVKHIPTEPATVAIAEQYEKVADKYSKTPAAGQALLRAGATYFDAGEYQKAQDSFARFLRSYSDTPWVPQAQYGIAACFEAQGKNSEAIAKFNDFLKSYASDPAADEARFSLARLYEKSSQPAQAIDLLTKMTNGVPPFSPVIGEVQERLRAIYAKNPALLPAPAPRTPPMATPSILTNWVRPQTNLSGTGAAPRISVQTPTATPAVRTPAPTPGAAPKIELTAPPTTPPKK